MAVRKGVVIGIGIAMLASASIAISPAFSNSVAAERVALLQPTPFETPTPNADGAILYTVLDGDSLWRIAAIAEISVEELMALNGIQSGDFISPGMELVLGSIAATPVPPPSPTPTVQTGPLVGTGDICVLLFTDDNGNARLDEDELPLPEGQVSVVDRDGSIQGEHTTDDNLDGFCFSELEDGDYNVSGAVPPNYNPTTSMNVPVRLAPGDTKFVQFGGQPSGAILQISGSEDEGSTLLGVLGLALLAAAGIVGYYAVRAGRTP
ncbi:MAG: LysM peptidoglycan-binding domain-containing protein [Anaerolineales bacterium]